MLGVCNMPASLDPKVQFFLDNLVTSKHSALMEMLTEDAVMEFPYAPPTRPARLVGKPEIVRFFAGFGDFLVLDAVHLVAAHPTTDPDIAVVEMEGRGKYAQTRRPYFQKYVSVLTFRGGRIAHWKDYWNPSNVTEGGESD